MEKVRTIKLFKDYFKEFYIEQTDDVRDKINFVLRLVETQRIIPRKFFRIIEGSDGIYEIRVELDSNIFRIFCCLDKGSIVVFSWIPKEDSENTIKRNKTCRGNKERVF